MAERRSRLRRAAAATALALGLLAGCGGGGDKQEFAGTLHDPYRVPATPLVDTSGAAYSLATDTDRPLTLVFFGYTNCDDFCPMVMTSLSSALTRLDDEQRRQVQLVFVTTDPKRDTPEVLRHYLDRYDPDAVGLTGDLDTIVSVGKELAIYVDDGTKLPDGGYDLTAHSTYVTGIGSDDQARVVWDMQTSSAQFAADITALLDGKAPDQ